MKQLRVRPEEPKEQVKREGHLLERASAAELEQMIAEPHQPAKLVVHWLNLLADLQIRDGGNYEMVSQTLQRIIDRVPNLAAAEMARNRLAILKLELKANAKTDGIKLGTYEQRLGLKSDARRGPNPDFSPPD